MVQPLTQGKSGRCKGEGKGWSTREVSTRGARNRKHVSEPDGQIGQVDPNGRPGKAGPGCQVEQAGC
eukprot:2635291-Pyramimonas_sp.AAC.1